MESAPERERSRLDFVESDGPQVIILADDLTGASDSAAAFLGRRRRARVWLGDRSFESADVDVLSFSTESRNEAAPEAAARVRRFAEELYRLLPAGMFFKKVDSAGRGYFAEEMEAARLAIGAELTMYAPAFPAAGRRVLNGELHVWDVTGRASRIRLRELFPLELRDRVASIPVGTEIEIEASLLRAIEEGRHVMICDAASQSDLQRMVRVARRLPQRLLWAGSAGLGLELAQTLNAGTGKVDVGSRKEGKTLIICGTPHPLTQVQMERLSRVAAEAAMDCVVAQVRCGTTSDEELQAIFNDAGEVGSLVLTGGDTAAMVLRALGADAIDIAGEMSPGIPWGVLRGGLADGCVVITKSGGFGDEHVLVDALHFCRGVAS